MACAGSPAGTPCIGTLGTLGRMLPRTDIGYHSPTTGSATLPGSASVVAEPCSSSRGREGHDLISPRVSSRSDRCDRSQL